MSHVQLQEIIQSAKPDKLVGQTLSTILSTDTMENQRLHFEFLRLISSKQPFEMDITIGDRSYQLKAAPLMNGSICVMLLNDVTPLLELSELKTRMLKMASHDIKNPLARIIGFSELLQMDATLNEPEQQYLDYIFTAADEMKKIIDDILDMERLKSSKMNLEWTDLQQLITDVCSSHEPDALRKQQVFQFDDMPEEIIFLECDVSQLSQALSNLIGNALKYTPNEGKITVRLSHEQDAIQLAVEDTGYGIPQEAQSELFTEFYRVRTKETAGIAGTGLGLSLVKTVIDAHHGQIWFESEEGVGSTFFVRLPMGMNNHAK